MRTVLVTNATQYAGTGAVGVLRGQSVRVVCHDSSFDVERLRENFQQEFPGVRCLRSHLPSDILDELIDLDIEVDALVSNDVFPIAAAAVGCIEIESLRETFEAVFLYPVDLAQHLLPSMKRRGGGSFVFVTSARSLRPEHGFATPTALRAGTTAFALAMAKEVASSNIQVNVVAPNYLHSELYYPKARFVDDPDGRKRIEATVPMGRLGTQEEVGELIAFLASGRSMFTTGQVIHFTGGWP